MPCFGKRSFMLRMPSAPTGGPFCENKVVYNDEYLATEIGQTKIPAPDDLLAGSAPDLFATLGGSWGGCHGIVYPAVRRRAGVRLPLLRPHCHLRLPERPVAAGEVLSLLGKGLGCTLA